MSDAVLERLAEVFDVLSRRPPPLEPYPSALIDHGHAYIMADVSLAEVLVGRRARLLLYNPRDPAGYPSSIERALNPRPLWTRYTLGIHEAARHWRRHR